jgi:lipid kinase YegS
MRLLLHGSLAKREDIKAAVEEARLKGNHVEVRVSWETGDMERLAAEAVEDGVEILVTAGGDQTVSETVTGMFKMTGSIRERPSLGILPLGRVNDFALACSIPADPRSAFRLICSTEPEAVDVGWAENRALVNMATGGVGPMRQHLTPSLRKSSGGTAAYYMACLANRRRVGPVEGTICGPGFKWSGPFTLLAIGNGRRADGGNEFCPQACIDDGLLDLRVLPDLADQVVTSLLQELQSNGEAAIEERLVKSRLSWMEFESDQDQHLKIDGQSVVRSRFRIQLEPRSLGLYLPKTAQLLQRDSADIIDFSEYSH